MSAPRNTLVVPLSVIAVVVASVLALALIAGGYWRDVSIVLALGATAFAFYRLSADRQALGRQLRAMESLAAAGADAGEDPDAPLRRFLLAASELTGCERGVVWMENEAGSGLRPRAVLAPSGGAGAPGDPGSQTADSLVLQALGRSSPVRIPRVDSTVASVASGSPESWLLCPIRLRGRSIGVAQLVAPAERPLPRSAAGLIEPLAGLAAVSFEAACVRQLMHRFADMAEMDGLTGVANRRRMSTILNGEVERAARYSHPLAVMMLDVDGFKAFNDRYGHPQGDRVLQGIARVLRSGVRRVDHVGRYGGEEFIVVLPETTAEAAYSLAERLRIAVESEGFDTGVGTVIRKTVSIGVSCFPRDGQSTEELVQRADEALYRAKRAGRNRVLVG